MTHVNAIAHEAHPIGSAEHEKVRAYIVSEITARGLKPEVQESTVECCLSSRTTADHSRYISAGTVRNVITRLNGWDNTKAILLVAHYDTVPNSPGASDDTSGVAALLETMRALKSTQQLRNDVIFLFSDGEEAGMLGSKAFVEEHRWVKDVGLVLNFDARGTGGPVFMFETSSQNGWLIKNFAKTAVYPAATSYMYDVYRILPNDTDLTSFIRKTPVAGLNFAFINNSGMFHRAVDNVQNLDERSIQHDGSYTLDLTRAFGNMDLSAAPAASTAGPRSKPGRTQQIYFDLLGLTLVHYPSSLVIPIAVFVFLVFAGVTIIGFRKKYLTPRGLIAGFAAQLVSIVCVALAAKFTLPLIRFISPTLNSGSRSRSFIFMGFVALTICIVAAIYSWFGKKVDVHNLAMGGLFCWLMLMAAASLLLPGTSYLFAWPLMFSLIPLAVLFVSNKRSSDSPGFFALICLCAIPGILIIVPTVYALFMGLGLLLPEVLMVILTLLIGLLVPHLSLLTKTTRWALVGSTGVLAVILLTVSMVIGGHGVNYPRTNSLFYGLNADTGAAVWSSSDEELDEWTSQFIASEKTSDMSAYFPLAPEEFISSPAPTVPLQAPVITTVNDSQASGSRTLRLHISSPRGAPTIEVVTAKDAEVTSAQVNGKGLTLEKNRLLLRYFGLPKEGIDLTLQMKSAQPVAIRVADFTYGITASTGIPIKERPEGLMPKPTELSLQNSAAVSKAYVF